MDNGLDNYLFDFVSNSASTAEICFFRCIKPGCGDSCNRNKRDRDQKDGHDFSNLGIYCIRRAK